MNIKKFFIIFAALFYFQTVFFGKYLSTSRKHKNSKRPRYKTQMRLIVHLKDVKINGPWIIYKPGRKVKSKRYHTYYFTKAEFNKKIGRLIQLRKKTNKVSLLINKYKKALQKHKVPAGPIYTFTHYCSILRNYSTNISIQEKLKTKRINRKVRLSIKPRYLRKKGNKIIYSPYSNARRSKYHIYIFKYNNFRKFFGSINKINRHKRTIKALVLLKTSKISYNYVPVGKITHTTYTCEILK